MKKTYLLLLSILSAFILSLSWPLRGFPFLSLIGLVPLIFVLEYINNNKEKFTIFASFRYSYICFFLWNVLTTWWIWYSTEIGAALAIIVNSLFMALVVQLAAFTRGKIENRVIGITILPIFWIAFEYAHQHWDLSWSWLILGNAFASRIAWIQWYEITGVLGGSVWIWIVNIFAYFIVASFVCKNKSTIVCRKASIIAISTLIIIPSAWSIHRYITYTEKENPVNIVLLQPNLDPYNEEYTLSIEEIIERIFSEKAKKEIDTNVNFIVAPESVLQEGMFEDEFAYSKSINLIKNRLKTLSPQAQMITGAGTFRMFKPNEPLGASARQFEDGSHFEAFNSALYFDTLGIPIAYHKSKLVPGVEQMPFANLIKPIQKLAIDLGGTTGTLGKSKDQIVYKKGKVPISAIICYESIYGEFVAKFVKNGSQIIFVITNDGWWKNTAGHRQHFAYSKLRAVETRRSIARAANTGISCFINQRGDVLTQTEYWKRDAIKLSINANDKITFFVKHGDYIGKSLMIISALLLILASFIGIIQKLGAGKRRN